jgi:tetratricopeptide (TPR) repeat protein
LELNPDFPMGWHVIGGASLANGDTALAIQAHEKLAATRPAWVWSLGYTYARTGRHEEARRIAAELARKVTPMGAWGLTEINIALDDRDEAIRWLDTAIARRWSWVPWIGFDTLFAPLRDDGRFQERLRRLNLPGPGANR